MINPKTIGGELVALLRTLPNLMGALGGEGNVGAIQYYSENAVVFGQQSQSNVMLALLTMPPGSLMVAWQGSGPVKWGGALHYGHRYSVFVRAPENPGIGYEDLWSAFVNDIPDGLALPMQHVEVDPNCSPMDLELPAADRKTIVVSVDGATFEYFEFRLRLVEVTNP